MNCATCKMYACRSGHTEKQPEDCPMVTEPLVYQEGWAEYLDYEVGDIARVSARTEAAGYGQWTRIQEVLEFSRRAGFRRLGLAFCSGLRQEARQLVGVFEGNGKAMGLR